MPVRAALSLLCVIPVGHAFGATYLPPGPPSASAPPAASPPAASAVALGAARKEPVALRPIRNVQTQEPAVAITFDACATRGQDNSFDRPVFEILKRERVPATIFVSGRWVEAHPEAMLELAREPLIEFGDHSYEHPRMSRLDAVRIADEIDRTEAALAKYGKRSVAFRPPFGDWNRRVVDVVQEKQLPTVTWDVVSGDPSTKTTKEGMVRSVLGKVRPGSIVVFHINGRGWKTAAALPEILSGLRERGFRFVQVSELIGAGVAPVVAGPAPASPFVPVPLPAASAASGAGEAPVPAAHLER